MKKISFIKAMAAFVLMGIAICVIGGDLNPGNTPSPTMRTLDELYKNIQPGAAVWLEAVSDAHAV